MKHLKSVNEMFFDSEYNDLAKTILNSLEEEFDDPESKMKSKKFGDYRVEVKFREKTIEITKSSGHTYALYIDNKPIDQISNSILKRLWNLLCKNSEDKPDIISLKKAFL